MKAIGKITATSITSYDTVKEILTGDAFNFLPINESLLVAVFGLLRSQPEPVSRMYGSSQEIRIESRRQAGAVLIVGAYYIDTKRYISTGNLVDFGKVYSPVYRTPAPIPQSRSRHFWRTARTISPGRCLPICDLNFSDQFRVDASLRYDRDKRVNTTLTPTAFLPNVPGFPQGATGEKRRANFDDLQPKVTLTYQPTDDITLYGGIQQWLPLGRLQPDGRRWRGEQQWHRRRFGHLQG